MRGRFKKFLKVEHHTYGELDPDRCFVLVPDRDPAAVAAMRAYAQATPDTLLAADLVTWADRIEGVEGEGTELSGQELVGYIHTWTAALTTEVKDGRMTIETALQRIAGHTMQLAIQGLEEEDA